MRHDLEFKDTLIHIEDLHVPEGKRILIYAVDNLDGNAVVAVLNLDESKQLFRALGKTIAHIKPKNKCRSNCFTCACKGTNAKNEED